MPYLLNKFFKFSGGRLSISLVRNTPPSIEIRRDEARKPSAPMATPYFRFLTLSPESARKNSEINCERELVWGGGNAPLELNELYHFFKFSREYALASFSESISLENSIH